MKNSVPASIGDRSRLVRRSLLFALLAAALLSALVWAAGAERFWRGLRAASAPALLLAVAVYAATWGLRTLRLVQLTARLGGRIGPMTLFRLAIASMALNSVLPGRVGDAAHVLYLHWQRMEPGVATAVVVQTRVLDSAALALLSLAALLTSILAGRVCGLVGGGIVMGAAVAAAPAAAAWLVPRTRLAGAVERLAQRQGGRLCAAAVRTGRDSLAAYRAIARDGALWARTAASSALIMFGEVATAAVVCRAVNVHVPFSVVLLAVALGTASKAAGLTPGGIGVYEAGFSGVLALSGVGPAEALLAAIVDHGLKKAFNICLGLPWAWRQGSPDQLTDAAPADAALG